MRSHAVRTAPGNRIRPTTRWATGGAIAVLATLALAVPTALPAAATIHGRAVVKAGMTTGPLGIVLVSSKGRTLYVDIHDRANHVTCTAACARSWPPLLLARGVTRPVGGSGVKGLGTVRRPGHRLQVTWHKMPLYLFTGDVRPGQVNGQGVGTIFFVLTPKGVVRSTPTAPTAPTAPTTPTSAPPTGATPAPAAVMPTSPPATTPASGGSHTNSPPATSPPATSPPATSPPATSPPATSPPVTSPPTTAPAGGGVAY